MRLSIPQLSAVSSSVQRKGYNLNEIANLTHCSFGLAWLSHDGPIGHLEYIDLKVHLHVRFCSQTFKASELKRNRAATASSKLKSPVRFVVRFYAAK